MVDRYQASVALCLSVAQHGAGLRGMPWRWGSEKVGSLVSNVLPSRRPFHGWAWTNSARISPPKNIKWDWTRQTEHDAPLVVNAGNSVRKRNRKKIEDYISMSNRNPKSANIKLVLNKTRVLRTYQCVRYDLRRRSWCCRCACPWFVGCNKQQSMLPWIV